MPGLQLVERDLERRYSFIGFFIITPLHSPALFLRCPQLISDPPVLTPRHCNRLPIGLPRGVEIPAAALLDARGVQCPPLASDVIQKLLVP